MSSKGTLNTGAAGRTPPENFRTTRSHSKVTTQQANTSPQAATLEKKRAKTKELEMEARKLLLSEECLTDEANITHHTILHALTLILQKYSTTIPQNLTRVLTALAALLKQVNNASHAAAQFEPTVDALSQKVGERIEKAMQEEMEKMSVKPTGGTGRNSHYPQTGSVGHEQIHQRSNNGNVTNQRHCAQLQTGSPLHDKPSFTAATNKD
ncbi:hypothetical protein V8E53_004542 [Lactarius tabidus]